jgi:hypothetical protein
MRHPSHKLPLLSSTANDTKMTKPTARRSSRIFVAQIGIMSALTLTCLNHPSLALSARLLTTHFEDEETVGAFRFGYRIAGGDFNGDGVGDLFVGAPPTSSLDSGRLYGYFGRFPDSAWSMVGEGPFDGFARSLANVGDVNGDRLDDLLVGASLFSEGRGRVYLLLGRPRSEMTIDHVFTGSVIHSRVGEAVASAGDMNGDGYSDIIVGSSGSDQAMGAAQIFWGDPSPDLQPDLTLVGEGGSFARQVAGVGDVNGDTFDDVVVSASSFDAFRGRVYVYFGGVAPDSLADLVLDGSAEHEGFGACVARVGDLNDDGFSELAVSTFPIVPDYPALGRIRVYFGGPQADVVADLTLTGKQLDDGFGFSFAGGDDLDGDGVADLVVGVPWADGSRGTAYVYCGGEDVDSVEDLVLSGQQSSDRFAYSVALTPDLTGDGRSEISVGAPWHARGQTYVYRVVTPITKAADASTTRRESALQVSPSPNPRVGSGSGVFTVTSVRSGPLELSIVDASGRTVARRRIESGSNPGMETLVWDPGRLVSGVYFVTARTASGASSIAKWTVIQ